MMFSKIPISVKIWRRITLVVALTPLVLFTLDHFFYDPFVKNALETSAVLILMGALFLSPLTFIFNRCPGKDCRKYDPGGHVGDSCSYCGADLHISPKNHPSNRRWW